MNEFGEPANVSGASPEPLSALPAPPRKMGRPFLAWTVILLLVSGIVFVNWYHPRSYSSPTAKEATPLPADDSGLLAIRMQGRYWVGAAQFLGGRQLYPHTLPLNAGTVDQRLRFVTLAGELAGPEEAINQLKAFDEKIADAQIQLTSEQKSLEEILRRLYKDYSGGRFDAPSVSANQRQVVQRDLGWFGELALAPADGSNTAARQNVIGLAQRTFLAVIGAVVALGLFAVLGLIGLGLLLTLLFTGKVRHGIYGATEHGGIYAETFAIYLLLYIGLSFAFSWIPIGNNRLLLAGAAVLLSLAAVAWPILRGIPWQEVRHEIGFYAGRQPPLEPAIGIGTYAMALPLLAFGLLLTLMLILIQGGFHSGEHTGNSFAPDRLPSHPVVFSLISPDWWSRLQVFLLACFIAPLVEETMFRGVLYRHLRDSSEKLGFVLSFLLSATVTSFIFAVIHPQGWVTIPALMALAYGFSIAREWRGTLIPGMVAHGINNGVVLTFVILAMGD